MGQALSTNSQERLQQVDWHARYLQEVFSRLQTQRDGLTEREACSRLEIHGANELPQPPAATLVQILLRQFKSS